MNNVDRESMYQKICSTPRGKYGNPLYLTLIIFLYISFFVGFGIAGTLVIGKVYSFLPDEGLVNISRIIGAISFIIYFVLVYFISKIYEEKIRPLYVTQSTVEEIVLGLREISANKIGYTSRKGVIELSGFTILREDDKFARIKCKCYNTQTDRDFIQIMGAFKVSYIEFTIAKEDPIYSKILDNAEVKQASPVKVNSAFLIIALIIYIGMIVINCILLDVRDRNTISFSIDRTVEINRIF